jgi:hypothetical protein
MIKPKELHYALISLDDFTIQKTLSIYKRIDTNKYCSKKAQIVIHA